MGLTWSQSPSASGWTGRHKGRLRKMILLAQRNRPGRSGHFTHWLPASLQLLKVMVKGCEGWSWGSLFVAIRLQSPVTSRARIGSLSSWSCTPDPKSTWQVADTQYLAKKKKKKKRIAASFISPSCPARGAGLAPPLALHVVHAYTKACEKVEKFKCPPLPHTIHPHTVLVN